MEVISLDCRHQCGLWIAGDLIDVHLVFLYEQLDQVKVAIVAAPVQSIDFGVSGQVGI